nr:hypothetical protein OG781_21465 [Streptomyces sp. NBC_00830]
MQGYGYVSQQQPKRRPSTATLTALRVVFVALTVLSCGMLGWAAMVRLACVTRRGRDWIVCAVVFALNVGLFAFMVYMPEDPEKTSDAEAIIGMGWLLGVLVGVVAYYLYAEIRHYGPLGPGWQPPYAGYVPPQFAYGTEAQQSATPGYGYGYPPTRQPLPADPRPTAPEASAPQPAPPQPPAPQPATPQRIDQVRAELDELSDYLRKEEGR